MTRSSSLPLAGRRLLLLPRYSRGGPSSRQRMYQFVPHLEAAGATVRAEPFFDEDYLAGFFERGVKRPWHVLGAFRRRFRALRGIDDADAVWIEKEVFPFLPGRFEALIGKRGKPYVVDYDDATFHSYDRSRNPLVRWTLANKLDPLLAGAACIFAGNDYLEDYVRRHGARKVVQVPTTVDAARYSVSPPREGGPLRVGWIGTPANARYLAPVVEVLNRLSATIPVELVTIGAPKLPGLEVRQDAHSWSEATEAELLSRIDVGVMPLTDAEVERGKCGYKLIQYMAAGKPVIASPVGVNTAIVTPDIGFLASNMDEWSDALTLLAGSSELRERMGRASRARMERDYSLDAVAPRIIRSFAESLADGRAGTAAR